MSRVSSLFRKAFLRSIKRSASKAGITLGAALDALEDSQFQEVKTGKSIRATSRSGHSVEVFIPRFNEGVTPTDIVELISELVNCYETAVAALNGGDPAYADSPDNNDAIFAYMVANCTGFRAVKSTLPDFSHIRQEAAFAA